MFKRAWNAVRARLGVVPADFWLLAGICLLALGLRLINLGAEPFWADEISSLDLARHAWSVRDLIEYLKEVEVHPPLYLLLLRYWIRLFGTSEFAVRLPSLLFGLATVPLTWLLTKRVFRNRAAALVSALIVAVLPMQIEFSQETHPFTIICFFGVLNSLAVWEYVRTGRRAWLAAYCLSALAGIYSHYSFGLIMAATSSWWLFRVVTVKEARSRRLVVWLAAQAVAFLGFWWWLDAFSYKFTLAAFEILGRQRIDFTPRVFDFFETVVTKSVWLTLNKDGVIGNVEIAVQAVFKIVLAWFALKTLCGENRKTEDAGAGPLAFAAWLFLIPLVLFFFSPQSMNYAPVFQRHVIFITVPMAMALGYLAARLGLKRGAVVIALLIISLIPRITDIVGNDADWDHFHRVGDVGRFIDGQYKPGDLVLTYVAYQRVPLVHYLRPDIPVASLLPVEFYGRDVWLTRETAGLIEIESSWRDDVASWSQVRDKLRVLVDTGRVKRVWLYEFPPEAAPAVGVFFDDKKWRHVYAPIGDIIKLDLYARRD